MTKLLRRNLWICSLAIVLYLISIFGERLLCIHIYIYTYIYIYTNVSANLTPKWINRHIRIINITYIQVFPGYLLPYNWFLVMRNRWGPMHGEPLWFPGRKSSQMMLLSWPWTWRCHPPVAISLERMRQTFKRGCNTFSPKLLMCPSLSVYQRPMLLPGPC